MKLFITLCLILISCQVLCRRVRGSSTCQLNTHIQAVDNVRADNYDLLLSVSTDDDCSIKCKVSDPNVMTQIVETYQYYGRFYYFFRFQNLKSFNIYNYDCGDSNRYAVQFPKNTETKILTFGDWSKHLNGLKTFEFLTKIIPQTKYDALVTLGDYSYNMGSSSDPSWDSGNIFFEWITPLTSKIPFMMNAGNHEYINRDFTQYMKRFLMPNKSNSQNLYYSFDINDVHFVSVTSEFGLINYKGSEYYKTFKSWFENDLKNSNKRWKVVYLHRPLYCSWTSKPRCSNGAVKLRTFFEDMFYKSKVDLILAGHLHNYERTYPVYKGQVDTASLSNDGNTYTNPIYPVHLICGTGGNREGVTPNCKIFLILDQLLKFSKTFSNEAGACELSFTHDSIKMRFLSTSSKDVDAFTIIKNK